MNLNNIKRGFTRTNPEKGLHSLPGAQKSDRRENRPHTIRVKGAYIEHDHNTVGKVLGISAWGLAWICNTLLTPTS